MVEEYKRKVVDVGNSICLIIPRQWKKLFEQKEVHGIWKVIRDEEGNMVRVEVSFQEEG